MIHALKGTVTNYFKKKSYNAFYSTIFQLYNCLKNERLRLKYQNRKKDKCFITPV